MGPSGLRTHRTLIFLAFVGPAIVVLVAVMVYPTALAFIMSVSNIELPDFTLRLQGFSAFVRTFRDPTFLLVAKNSLLWTIGCTAGQFLVGFGLALLLYRDRPAMKLFRILLFIPWTVPVIVVAINWWTIYNQDFGFIGYYLYRLTNIRGGLLGNPSTALPAVILVSVWFGYPFAMIMLQSALRTVPESLRDAAIVDGASGGQLLRYITIPWIRPVMSIVLILLSIDALNAFVIVNIMTGGGPVNSTSIFAQHIYLKGFRFFRFNDAAALSIIVLFITALLSAGYIRFVYGREWAERTE